MPAQESESQVVYQNLESVYSRAQQPRRSAIDHETAEGIVRGARWLRGELLAERSHVIRLYNVAARPVCSEYERRLADLDLQLDLLDDLLGPLPDPGF
jgi:hypothetical protein